MGDVMAGGGPGTGKLTADHFFYAAAARIYFRSILSESSRQFNAANFIEQANEVRLRDRWAAHSPAGAVRGNRAAPKTGFEYEAATMLEIINRGIVSFKALVLPGERFKNLSHRVELILHGLQSPMQPDDD